MNILSIETSCDETAVSIIEADGGTEKPHFNLLGNSLFSQIELHKEYGGVFPTLAKREHANNLIPLLEKALAEANLEFGKSLSEINIEEIKKILEREGELSEKFLKFAEKNQKPNIDVISVTSGPGLEPALWVGISFATALSKLWNIPVIGVNHMEGHIASVLFNKAEEIQNPNDQSPKEIHFPAVALLISGGHTELVQISGWGKYKILGQTRDDAVGEAFDKVARMLGLPYPGGPQISKLAQMAREQNILHKASLPRPMIHSDNLDFSFSGLKTSVLYYIRDFGPISDTDKMDIAREFEDAVVEVLVEKTKKALDAGGAKTLIIAGGVIANKKIREAFTSLENEYVGLVVKTPAQNLATDNAIMIACATYLNVIINPNILNKENIIKANGNLSLD
jgi:N6-L-threonylcarbamoyladenine synthase